MSNRSSEAMTTLSDEDVARVVQALEAKGYEVRPKGREPGAARVVLEEKYFRRIDKFSGDTTKWQEWLFNVFVAVSGVSAECVLAMEDVVKNASATSNPENLHLLVQKQTLDKYKSELFGVLCSLTEGEANVVVRSTIQRGLGYCGFAALCLLSQRFNPKTPARVLQLLTTVLNPKAVKDVRVLARAVEEWELQRGKLRAEFGEELSNNVQVAILTGMIPRDLQDMVFQLGHGGADLKYIEVRDKVMSVANHRSLMVTPTPMDIGRVSVETEEWQEEWWEDDVEVDAVGKGCHRCGGWGHFARDCPTPKGKGKGKGVGKGGKGEYATNKGGGKKGSGKGSGYQGSCWNCGKVGHKAAECQAGKGVNEVTEETREVASVGGVWSVSAVEKHTCTLKSPKPGVSRGIGRPDSSESVNSGEPAARPSRNAAAEDGQATQKPEWKTIPGRWKPKVVGNNENNVAITRGRFQVLDICPVELTTSGKKEEATGTDICALRTEITVDSAAEESVCPQGWAAHFGLSPVPKGQGMKLVNASGGEIMHYGSRRVAFQPKALDAPNASGGTLMSMGFQVTDVKKPLLAVAQICSKGNVVQFGPEGHQNYIQNVKTGEKVFMKRKGNSYVLTGDLAERNPF